MFDIADVNTANYYALVKKKLKKECVHQWYLFKKNKYQPISANDAATLFIPQILFYHSEGPRELLADQKALRKYSNAKPIVNYVHYEHAIRSISTDYPKPVDAASSSTLPLSSALEVDQSSVILSTPEQMKEPDPIYAKKQLTSHELKKIRENEQTDLETAINEKKEANKKYQ